MEKCEHMVNLCASGNKKIKPNGKIRNPRVVFRHIIILEHLQFIYHIYNWEESIEKKKHKLKGFKKYPVIV